MTWQTTSDVHEFLATAGGHLRRERARNTVMLTVTEQVRLDPARYAASPAGGPLFGWREEQPGTAFFVTPPHPLLLNAVTADDAAELARTLASRPLGADRPLGAGRPLVNGVNAAPEAAAAFAAAWCPAAGTRASEQRRERLYRLGALAWPAPPAAGAPRVAGEPDSALLTDWLARFHREVPGVGQENLAAAVRDRLSFDGFTLWETAGAPVALAGMSRIVGGMARVGPVYTPVELRGHGYASAATAAVSQRALDTGAEEVVLFTDLANPVSNSIYQRIGYQPVEDRLVLAFSAAP
jgi:RimJ/RimL family protein N-acetyltransferase